MKIRDREIDWKYIGKVLLCIAVGTASGLGVYAVFLHFNIAIFGWNLGLIFAPLTAGYVETVLANRIIGKNLGAVSAFILFIDTTYYSFILKNPTLGMNLITIGSIVVILQSAFPTLVNYILIVVLGAVASNFRWLFSKIWNTVKPLITNTFRWETPNHEPESEELPHFDEIKSNAKLNSLDFMFITSSDMSPKSHDILGIYQSEIIIENKDTLSVKREEIEIKRLVTIKEGKDECLIRLADKVKEAGGNCILDLNIQYGLIGLKGDHIHITATGIGIYVSQ